MVSELLFFPLKVGGLVRCGSKHAYLHETSSAAGILRRPMGRLPTGGYAVVLEAYSFTCRLLDFSTGHVGWTFSEYVSEVS